VITTGGQLKAKYVIHTPGPVYGKGGKDKRDLLAACYWNSLDLAAGRKLKSIAFPAISTGVYGYPADEAARVSSEAIENFLTSNSLIEDVRLVFFNPKDAAVFLQNHAFKK
jgi:O-acetyl-ADP-ribose deacetylase (regulator of RNase III)